MDLPRALVEQEEAARDQDDIPPGNGWPRVGKGRVRPRIQAIEASMPG
jgi:hypothetical protein